MKKVWTYQVNERNLIYSSFDKALTDLQNQLGNDVKVLKKEKINSCYIKFHFVNCNFITKKLLF